MIVTGTLITSSMYNKVFILHATIFLEDFWKLKQTPLSWLLQNLTLQLLSYLNLSLLYIAYVFKFR